MPRARFWFRYVVKGLWLPSLWKYLYGQAHNANAASGDDTPELRTMYRFRIGRMMRGCYWLSVLTMVHALHAWPIFFLFWVVPLLSAYPLYMQLREIAHHSNAPDDGELTNSRVFRVNPILSAAVFPYGQAFHVTHHLFAMVPHYRMACFARNPHALSPVSRPGRDLSRLLLPHPGHARAFGAGRAGGGEDGRWKSCSGPVGTSPAKLSFRFRRFGG